jgi:hypothetical protein
LEGTNICTNICTLTLTPLYLFYPSVISWGFLVPLSFSTFISGVSTQLQLPGRACAQEPLCCTYQLLSSQYAAPGSSGDKIYYVVQNSGNMCKNCNYVHMHVLPRMKYTGAVWLKCESCTKLKVPVALNANHSESPKLEHCNFEHAQYVALSPNAGLT